MNLTCVAMRDRNKLFTQDESVGPAFFASFVLN